jgi:hypothetical protein
MLPILRLRQNTIDIPWQELAQEFDAAPKEHDLEKGHAISTWNWGENARLDLEPWFAPVREQIAETVQRLLGITEPYEQWVNLSWMNRHWRTGQTAPHKHEGCDLVFSCYLDVPEGSGAFLLKWQDKWWRVPVATGDILVFPGLLEHATEASASDEPRTVMTINASPTGVGWNQLEPPDVLVKQGMTWPQALSSIRERYLAIHKTFQQRQQDLPLKLIAENKDKFETVPAPAEGPR